MKHLKKARKFGRKTDQRKALMKSLASSFFILGKIKTTEAKAKALRSSIERFLTKAKNPTLAHRRLLYAYFSERVVKKIIEHANAVSTRPGGYTRIIKMGERSSDAARMATMELVK